MVPQKNLAPMVAHLLPPAHSKNSLGRGVLSTDYPLAYPQYNGRAHSENHKEDSERKHSPPPSSLDNDNVTWAILQSRNTPIQSIGLSRV